jgi:hypothetical protein
MPLLMPVVLLEERKEYPEPEANDALNIYSLRTPGRRRTASIENAGNDARFDQHDDDL